MAYPFPPDLERMILDRMATGDYRSEDELLMDAMIALDDVAKRQQDLRAEIQRRVVHAGTSLSQPLDLDAFKVNVRRRLKKQD